MSEEIKTLVFALITVIISMYVMTAYMINAICEFRMEKWKSYKKIKKLYQQKNDKKILIVTKIGEYKIVDYNAAEKKLNTTEEVLYWKILKEVNKNGKK